MSTTSALTSSPRPRRADFRAYSAKVWRVVEAQHRISTNRLTANAEEQILLEELVDQVKPVLPRTAHELHYLLSTPFRYGHQQASRFRRGGERPGIFYASEHVAAAVAETAWWRLYFLSRSPGLEPPSSTIEHTAFTVRIDADRALDLTMAPLAAATSLWASPNDYTECQRFAAAARAIDAQLLRYASVRDPEHRANVALFDAAAFVSSTLKIEQTWHFRIEPGRLTAFAAFPSDERYTFDRP